MTDRARTTTAPKRRPTASGAPKRRPTASGTSRRRPTSRGAPERRPTSRGASRRRPTAATPPTSTAVGDGEKGSYTDAASDVTTAATPPTSTTVGDGEKDSYTDMASDVTTATTPPTSTTVGDGEKDSSADTASDAATPPTSTTVGDGEKDSSADTASDVTTAAIPPTSTTVGDGEKDSYTDTASDMRMAATPPTPTTVGDCEKDSYTDTASDATTAATPPTSTTVGDDEKDSSTVTASDVTTVATPPISSTVCASETDSSSDTASDLTMDAPPLARAASVKKRRRRTRSDNTIVTPANTRRSAARTTDQETTRSSSRRSAAGATDQEKTRSSSRRSASATKSKANSKTKSKSLTQKTGSGDSTSSESTPRSSSTPPSARRSARQRGMSTVSRVSPSASEGDRKDTDGELTPGARDGDAKDRAKVSNIASSLDRSSDIDPRGSQDTSNRGGVFREDSEDMNDDAQQEGDNNTNECIADKKEKMQSRETDTKGHVCNSADDRHAPEGKDTNSGLTSDERVADRALAAGDMSDVISEHLNSASVLETQKQNTRSLAQITAEAKAAAKARHKGRIDSAISSSEMSDSDAEASAREQTVVEICARMRRRRRLKVEHASEQAPQDASDTSSDESVLPPNTVAVSRKKPPGPSHVVPMQPHTPKRNTQSAPCQEAVATPQVATFSFQGSEENVGPCGPIPRICEPKLPRKDNPMTPTDHLKGARPTREPAVARVPSLMVKGKRPAHPLTATAIGKTPARPVATKVNSKKPALPVVAKALATRSQQTTPSAKTASLSDAVLSQIRPPPKQPEKKLHKMKSPYRPSNQAIMGALGASPEKGSSQPGDVLMSHKRTGASNSSDARPNSAPDSNELPAPRHVPARNERPATPPVLRLGATVSSLPEAPVPYIAPSCLPTMPEPTPRCTKHPAPIGPNMAPLSSNPSTPHQAGPLPAPTLRATMSPTPNTVPVRMAGPATLHQAPNSGATDTPHMPKCSYVDLTTTPNPPSRMPYHGVRGRGRGRRVARSLADGRVVFSQDASYPHTQTPHPYSQQPLGHAGAAHSTSIRQPQAPMRQHQPVYPAPSAATHHNKNGAAYLGKAGGDDIPPPPAPPIKSYGVIRKNKRLVSKLPSARSNVHPYAPTMLRDVPSSAEAPPPPPPAPPVAPAVMPSESFYAARVSTGVSHIVKPTVKPRMRSTHPDRRSPPPPPPPPPKVKRKRRERSLSSSSKSCSRKKPKVTQHSADSGACTPFGAPIVAGSTSDDSFVGNGLKNLATSSPNRSGKPPTSSSVPPPPPPAADALSTPPTDFTTNNDEDAKLVAKQESVPQALPQPAPEDAAAAATDGKKVVPQTSPLTEDRRIARVRALPLVRFKQDPTARPERIEVNLAPTSGRVPFVVYFPQRFRGKIPPDPFAFEDMEARLEGHVEKHLRALMTLRRRLQPEKGLLDRILMWSDSTSIETVIERIKKRKKKKDDKYSARAIARQLRKDAKTFGDLHELMFRRTEEYVRKYDVASRDVIQKELRDDDKAKFPPVLRPFVVACRRRLRALRYPLRPSLQGYWMRDGRVGRLICGENCCPLHGMNLAQQPAGVATHPATSDGGSSCSSSSSRQSSSSSSSSSGLSASSSATSSSSSATAARVVSSSSSASSSASSSSSSATIAKAVSREECFACRIAPLFRKVSVLFGLIRANLIPAWKCAEAHWRFKYLQSRIGNTEGREYSDLVRVRTVRFFHDVADRRQSDGRSGKVPFSLMSYLLANRSPAERLVLPPETLKKWVQVFERPLPPITVQFTQNKLPFEISAIKKLLVARSAPVYPYVPPVLANARVGLGMLITCVNGVRLEFDERFRSSERVSAGRARLLLIELVAKLKCPFTITFEEIIPREIPKDLRAEDGDGDSYIEDGDGEDELDEIVKGTVLGDGTAHVDGTATSSPIAVATSATSSPVAVATQACTGVPARSSARLKLRRGKKRKRPRSRSLEGVVSEGDSGDEKMSGTDDGDSDEGASSDEAVAPKRSRRQRAAVKLSAAGRRTLNVGSMLLDDDKTGDIDWAATQPTGLPPRGRSGRSSVKPEARRGKKRAKVKKGSTRASGRTLHEPTVKSILETMPMADLLKVLNPEQVEELQRSLVDNSAAEKTLDDSADKTA